MAVRIARDGVLCFSTGACVAGALDMDDYIAGLEGVGFDEVSLVAKTGDGELLEGIPQGNIFSASITARKPID